MGESADTLDGSRTQRGRLTAGVGEVILQLVKHAPDGVKRGLAGPYNRVKTFEANRTFRSRTPTSREPSGDAPDHVLLVVVDALRADALGWGAGGFLAERSLGAAVAPSPWTFPSVTSLLTGRYPHEHGAMRRGDEAVRDSTDLVIPAGLPLETDTIAEVFAGAGYRTYGGFGFHMPFFALGGRFERHALYDSTDAGRLLSDAADWLEVNRDERTFAYLHLADLHEPVDPPERYWRDHDVDGSIPDITRWDYVDASEPGPEGERFRRHRRRLYGAALAYVDDQLRRFHERVAGTLDGEVVVVVTGDHGEGFWEHVTFDAERFVDSRPAHSVDHGGTPYEAIARVPLVVDGTDVAPIDSVAAPASLVDVAPTLLDAIGLPDALPTSGHSLSSSVPPGRIPIVEGCRYGHEKKAAYHDGWKLLVSKRDDVSIGFSLPDEEPMDLPTRVERTLAGALPPWPEGDSHGTVVSSVARQRLSDLGYV